MISNNPSASVLEYFSHTNIKDLTEDNFGLLSSSDIMSYLSDNDEEPIVFGGAIENWIEYIIKNPLFKIELCNKKRGRKYNEDNKKQEHTPLSPDNIKRKIQVHFLSFMISFANDYIHTYPQAKGISFLNFEGINKSKVSREHFEKIKKSSIKELFENMGISNKYKRYCKNNNKENIVKLAKFDWFQQFFDKNYLEIFDIYYNNGLPLEKISLLGKTIHFSKRTKPFFNLLQKYKNSREYINILNGVKNFFLPDNDSIETKSFKKDYLGLNELNKNLESNK